MYWIGVAQICHPEQGERVRIYAIDFPRYGGEVYFSIDDGRRPANALSVGRRSSGCGKCLFHRSGGEAYFVERSTSSGGVDIARSDIDLAVNNRWDGDDRTV